MFTNSLPHAEIVRESSSRARTTQESQLAVGTDGTFDLHPSGAVHRRLRRPKRFVAVLDDQCFELPASLRAAHGPLGKQLFCIGSLDVFGKS